MSSNTHITQVNALLLPRLSESKGTVLRQSGAMRSAYLESHGTGAGKTSDVARAVQESIDRAFGTESADESLISDWETPAPKT